MASYLKPIKCVLCFCFCTTLIANSPPDFQIDSKEKDLSNAKANSIEKAELLLELSRAYKIKNDTAKIRMYALEALELAQSNGWAEIEGNASICLGVYYLSTDKYYIAHSYFKSAEKIFMRTKKLSIPTAIYQNLMILFNNIDDQDNLEVYAGKLLELALERKDFETEMLALKYLGEAQFKSSATQEALDYNVDLYKRSLQSGNSQTAIIAWNCGNILKKMQRASEALDYFNKAFESDETYAEINVPAVYADIAETYTMMQMLDSATFFMNKAKEIADPDDRAKMNIFRITSLIEANKGDYKSALGSFKQFHHLSDSLSKAGRTAEIARLKNWHELEQKDNENLILQQEHQKQKKLIIVLMVALVLIFGLLGLSISLYRKTVEKNRELKKLHTVKDKLFSVVAHDLRSPISSLMSILKLATADMLDEETQAKLIKDITSRVDDTYGLIDNLLRWSKNQMQGMVPAPTNFDVKNEAKLVLDTLSDIAAAKKITINNLITNQEVFADRDMFAVVVRNLTMNAIKYSSQEGEITLNSEQEGNMLFISVKDNGVGMSKEVQEKIFNLSETKSQRGTNNESGTGLGLVLCADFVKSNGGTIKFTSKQGEGSTFYFSVPLKFI